MSGPVTWEALVFVVGIAGGAIAICFAFLPFLIKLFVKIEKLATKSDLSEVEEKINHRLDQQWNEHMNRNEEVAEAFKEIEVRLARAGINGGRRTG